MSYKTDIELKTQVDAVIVVNGNREITPPLHNSIETNIIDSKINKALTNTYIFVGDASNLAAAVAMSGQATIDNTGVITLNNGSVIGKVLTGYSSVAGTVSATDTILQAIEKLNGNIVVLDAAAVHKTGTETIAGAKTFSDLVTVDDILTGSGTALDKAIKVGGAGSGLWRDGSVLKWIVNSVESFWIGEALNTSKVPFIAESTVTISALTATTVPYLDASKNLASSAVTPTELGYLSGVTSGIQAQLNTKHGYTLQASSPQFNPSDATNYFCGFIVSTVASTGAQVGITIPKTGILKRVDVVITNSGTAGTSETSTVYFRLNDTTDTTINSSVVTTAVRGAFSSGVLSVAVTAGDYFEIKWTTPTWATNPTNIRFNAIAYIE